MKKMYISDLIPIRDCEEWLDERKILLVAPTGMGKTTFVLSRLVPYCAIRKKKIAILCNRRLLREQYLYDLAEQYQRFYVMEREVELFTYQALAEQMKQGVRIAEILREFDMLVCDEAHYFYADADFNGYGTFALLQALIDCSIDKVVVFRTATAKEVTPLIENTLEYSAERMGISNENVYKMKCYDYSHLADFSRFHCCYVEDMETLCKILGESPKKTIIFIDDKAKAESMKKNFTDQGIVKAKDIFILNAEVLEKNIRDPIIQNLTICHRVLPKILITTSVLDNGVSIHDVEVGNVVIATDSELSFIQMLGRVRSESDKDVNLYFYPRGEKYFERRLEQTTEKMEQIVEIEEKVKSRKGNLAMQLWDDDAYWRNMVLLMEEDSFYYQEVASPIRIISGGYVLAVNAFAKEKLGNYILAYRKLQKKALNDEVEVVKEQLRWMKKDLEDLKIISSSYQEERRKKLRKELLDVKNFTNEELQRKKEKIAQDFFELIGDIVAKRQSFSKEKLIEICERFELKLEEKTIDGRKCYSIHEQNKMKN